MKFGISNIGTIITILSLLLLSTNCKKDNNEDPELKDLYVYDISQDSDWDYWAVDKTGGYLLIKEEGLKPSVIFSKQNSDHEGYPIFLDESGLPSKTIIDNYVFMFTNLNGKFMDITIISPDGNVETITEIETEYDWSELKQKSATDEWSNVLTWASHVAGGVACGLSVAGTLVSGGVGAPLAIISCGAFIFGVIAELSPEDSELLGFSASEVGAAATFIGCTSPGGLASCVVGLSSIALDAVAQAAEAIELTSYIKINGEKYPLNLGYNVWFSEMDCGNNDVYVHGVYLTSDIIYRKYGNDTEGKSLLGSGIGNEIVFNMASKYSSLVDGEYQVVDGVTCDGKVFDDGFVSQMNNFDKFVMSESNANDPTHYILNTNLDIDWNSVNMDNPATDVVNKYNTYRNSIIRLEDGKVEISKNGSVYNVSFDCTDKNGQRITGKYVGMLYKIDFAI